jgi:hypothetical protein
VLGVVGAVALVTITVAVTWHSLGSERGARSPAVIADEHSVHARLAELESQMRTLAIGMEGLKAEADSGTRERVAVSSEAVGQPPTEPGLRQALDAARAQWKVEDAIDVTRHEVSEFVRGKLLSGAGLGSPVRVQDTPEVERILVDWRQQLERVLEELGTHGVAPAPVESSFPDYERRVRQLQIKFLDVLDPYLDRSTARYALSECAPATIRPALGE